MAIKKQEGNYLSFTSPTKALKKQELDLLQGIMEHFTVITVGSEYSFAQLKERAFVIHSNFNFKNS